MINKYDIYKNIDKAIVVIFWSLFIIPIPIIAIHALWSAVFEILGIGF